MEIGFKSEIIDKLLIFTSGVFFFGFIHLIRVIQKRSKNIKKTLNVTPDIKANTTNNELSNDPVLNGDFLTYDILDKKFKEISIYQLNLIKSKNSQEELKKIKFKKIALLIESIELFEPKSKSREEKKLLIQYLKKFNRPIKSISFKELLELEKEYLFPIIDKNEKYGWRFKNQWLWGFLLLLPIEILIWVFINFIIRIFIYDSYYFVPILSTYYLIKSYKDQKELRASRKLW